VVKKCHPFLKSFIPVVNLLGTMLGKEYEIVLHDISGKKSKIIAIINEEITGRGINSPMSDLGLFLIKNKEIINVDFLANYPSQMAKGRELRSGVALIRDENRKLIGFLCINYDMTKGFILKDIGTFLTTLQPFVLQGVEISAEKFYRLNTESTAQILEEVRQKMGKPLHFLTKKERIRCICWLEERGFLNLKGAVRILAREMSKSRHTLYADLRLIRSEQKGGFLNYFKNGDCLTTDTG